MIRRGMVLALVYGAMWGCGGPDVAASPVWVVSSASEAALVTRIVIDDVEADEPPSADVVCASLVVRARYFRAANKGCGSAEEPDPDGEPALRHALEEPDPDGEPARQRELEEPDPDGEPALKGGARDSCADDTSTDAIYVEFHDDDAVDLLAPKGGSDDGLRTVSLPVARWLTHDVVARLELALDRGEDVVVLRSAATRVVEVVIAR